MASIEKRGDCQWRALVRRKGYPTQSKTFETRKESEAWARMVESEMDRGVFISRVEAERTTLREALERYLEEVTPRKKGAAREQVRIERWMDNHLSKRSLASLRGADFAKFRDDWRKTGKAENTIRLELALISHLFETARKDWGMEALANPVKSISLPGQSNKRERRLEADEENRIIAELRKGRNKFTAPAVEFAIETAMRQGEILKLVWADIDFKKRVAMLRDTKNGENRSVPLSSRSITILSDIPRPIDGGRVFRVTQDGLIRSFSRAVTAARETYVNECKEKGKQTDPKLLMDLRFHDLRHEATSRLFERGDFDMMEVAAITGHKTLHMLKRYTQLRAEKLAEKLG